MAIVKTLIVKGVARFLTDAYMSTIRSGIWNGSTIQVGYGGTGVTSAVGNQYTPVFLSSSGIAPCSVEIPHATKNLTINGITYTVFTNSTGTISPIYAPTSLAGTGGYILATNSAKTGLEWVAANSHTHSQYVLLDSGTNEQVIKSSISSLGNGVIELWRATSGGYPMIGFANGTTKTHLGKLGFGAEANKPIFRNTSNTDYLLAHAGNTVNDNITVSWNAETTIATIAGIPIKIKIPANPDRRKAFYGTCDTAAATAAKVVTLSDTTGWVLVAGTIVGVKFTNSNTASNITLAVNGEAAKSIFYNNAAYTGSSADICGKANCITYYMYDGTNWVWLNSGYVINTTYSAGTAALIQAGTDTTNRVWQAKILQDEFVSKRGDTMTGAITLCGLNAGALAENSDYDTIADGIWHSYTDANSRTLINAPTTTSQVLFKFTPFANGASDTRTAYFVLDANGKAFLRGSREANSPWHTIAHTGNISQSANPVSIGWNTSTTIATIAGVNINVKIPANPNTWRNIYTGGTSRVGTATNTKAINFTATGNLSVAYLAAGTDTGQSGSTDYFTIQIKAAANAVGVAGYVAAPTKAANPNQVWMTNADGVPAWRNAIASAVLADAANSTTQLTTAQANPFYNLLFGGSIVRSVQFVAGEGMTVGTTDGSDVKITNVAPVYYIKGNADATAGTWTGTDSRISAYYEGLTIVFVPQVAGASTTTLNINGLGAKTCYFTNTSKLTTHYAVGTPIMLTYYADTWRRADYDYNTWRNVYTNGTSRIGTGTGTKAINFASTNLTINYLAAGTDSGQSGNANYFTIKLDAKNWVGATSSAAGTAGYMPGAAAADRTKFLRGDGSWIALAPSISAGTENTNKVKITVGGENSSEFTIPYATRADNVDGYHENSFMHRWNGSGNYYTKFLTFTRQNEKGWLKIYVYMRDNSSTTYGGEYLIHWGYDATNTNKVIEIKCLYSIGIDSATSVYAVRKSGTQFDLVFGSAKNGGSHRIGFGLYGHSNTCTIDNYTVTSYAQDAGPTATYTSSAQGLICNITGNASTASKWQTARTLTIGNTGKSVNGSADVSWSLAEIGASSSDHTHSVKINGSTKTIAAPGGTAVDLGSYLPLTGGTMSLGEGLKFHADENYFGTNADARIISLLDGNGTTCDGGLIIDERATNNGTETVTELLRIRDNEFKWKGNVIAHAGNISNKAATIGTSLTTIATIAGVNITAKISDVTTQAIELVSVEKTLAVSTWTDMAAVNTYTGTYAIQINSGNVYASGVFTACGGTDSVIDEIPLHVADKGTNTWRPYARISAGQLQMTTNEATGTARTYTIKILKLI